MTKMLMFFGVGLIFDVWTMIILLVVEDCGGYDDCMVRTGFCLFFMFSCAVMEFVIIVNVQSSFRRFVQSIL